MGAPHRCTHPGCSKSFDRKYNLKCHLRIHSDEKPYRCTYTHCSRRFRWKSSLNHHLLSLDHTSRKDRQERLRRRRQSRAASAATTADHRAPPAPPPPLPPPPSPPSPPSPPATPVRAVGAAAGVCSAAAVVPAPASDASAVISTSLSFELSAPCRVDGLPSPVGVLPPACDVMAEPFRSQPPLLKPHVAPPLLAVFDDGAMAAPQLDALYQTLLF